jgi:hypothetical protein
MMDPLVIVSKIQKMMRENLQRTVYVRTSENISISITGNL